MPLRFTRRTMLAGAASGATLAVAGDVLALADFGPDALVRSILHRLIGPFAMAQADFDRMVRAIDRKAGLPKGPKLRVMATLEKSGWSSDLMASAPQAIRDRREMIERAVLTEFVVKTTYLQAADKAHDPIAYLGPHPCSSPFANFEMT